MTKELSTLAQTAIDIIINENERLRDKISDLESTVKALRNQVKIYEDKIDLIYSDKVKTYDTVQVKIYDNIGLISSDKVKAYNTMIEVIKGHEVTELDKQIELLQIMSRLKEVIELDKQIELLQIMAGLK